MRDLEYDSATVSGDPADPTNETDVRRLLTRVERNFNPHIRGFVETGISSQVIQFC